MIDFNKTATLQKNIISVNRAIQKTTSAKKKITKENKKFLKLIGLLK